MKAYLDIPVLSEHDGITVQARKLMFGEEQGALTHAKTYYVFWEPNETLKRYSASGEVEDTGEAFNTQFVPVPLDEDPKIRQLCEHPVGDGLICTVGIVVR